MMEHTKGPWYCSSGMVWADSEEQVAIARMARDEPRTMPTERDANARLIAEAPAMLEIVRSLAKLPIPKIHELLARIDGV
jgi:hypothetical protein